MGTIGGRGSIPAFHSGMQKPWSSASLYETDGSKSRWNAVSTMWFASCGCPGIVRCGNALNQGSGGPSCVSPTPTQIPGRLSMKKLTQWSGEITTSASARAALMRRPSSVNAAVRLSFGAGPSVDQLRTIMGPWLEAKTPTSSAMAGLRGGGAGGADPAQEIVFRHARHVEIEPQQVRVNKLREVRDVIAFDRGSYLRFQGVAVQHPRAVRAVLLRYRRALQVEEQLGEPVITHSRQPSVGSRQPSVVVF